MNNNDFEILRAKIHKMMFGLADLQKQHHNETGKDYIPGGSKGVIKMISDDEMESMIATMLTKGFVYVRDFSEEYVLMYCEHTQEKARLSWYDGSINRYT